MFLALSFDPRIARSIRHHHPDAARRDASIAVLNVAVRQTNTPEYTWGPKWQISVPGWVSGRTGRAGPGQQMHPRDVQRQQVDVLEATNQDGDAGATARRPLS